jgi:PAS domain S-box-containing protein
MQLLAALIYWVIVALWLGVLATVVMAFVRSPRTFGAIRLLLAVVATDTARNIIENVYFGLFFGSQYGLFPAAIGSVLGQPHLLIAPKVANVVASLVVLGLLLWHWLPTVNREWSSVVSELAQAEKRFRLLVHGVKEYAICWLDPHGFVTSWNAGAERIKGYSSSEAIGKHMDQFNTPARPRVCCRLPNGRVISKPTRCGSGRMARRSGRMLRSTRFATTTAS